MDFLKSIAIAASGLRAQAGRMRIIAENLANADSTAQGPGADPYRRKIPTFRSEVDKTLDAQVVALGRVRNDPSDFQLKYEPGTSVRRRQRQCEISQRQSADRNDGYAGSAAFLRSQFESHRSVAPHDSAHARHS